MTEPGGPSQYPLTDGLTRAMAAKAETRATMSPQAASARFGWTSRDIAQRFNVSERTARRWRQQDRVPARRAEQWREGTRAAASGRQRRQIERRGLRRMEVRGVYRVSRSRYRSRAAMPVRIMDGERISGATMREVYGALDEGRADDAERILSDALTDAYGASQPIRFDQVDGLDYTTG